VVLLCSSLPWSGRTSFDGVENMTCSWVLFFGGLRNFVLDSTRRCTGLDSQFNDKRNIRSRGSSFFTLALPVSERIHPKKTVSSSHRSSISGLSRSSVPRFFHWMRTSVMTFPQSSPSNNTGRRQSTARCPLAVMIAIHLTNINHRPEC
jgi:hypothetical protein